MSGAFEVCAHVWVLIAETPITEKVRGLTQPVVKGHKRRFYCQHCRQVIEDTEGKW